MKIVEWRVVRKNSLFGFATVEAPSGLIIHDVAVHVSHGSAWASPPSKPMMDRTGRLVMDNYGKVKWMQIITFASKQTRERWSSQVIEALQAAHPDALRETADAA